MERSEDIIKPLRDQKEFFALAERFRAAKDSNDVARLGDEFGRLIFAGRAPQDRCL